MQSGQVPRQRVASKEGVEWLQRQRELKVGGTSSKKIVEALAKPDLAEAAKEATHRTHLVRRFSEHAQLIRTVQDCEHDKGYECASKKTYLRSLKSPNRDVRRVRTRTHLGPARCERLRDRTSRTKPARAAPVRSSPASFLRDEHSCTIRIPSRQQKNRGLLVR